MAESMFQHFNKINVNDHVDKKMGLSYLSWTYAWATIKSYDMKATKKYKQFSEYDWNNAQETGRLVDYCKTDTGTYVVCTVTIKEHSETESLPVMDNKNKAVMQPNQMQINKTKQRAFVKCCALFGLGLYLYAGEDEPLDDSITDSQKSSLNNLFNQVAKLNGSEASKIASKTLQSFGVEDSSELDQKQAQGLITSINRRVNELKKKSQNKEKEGTK